MSSTRHRSTHEVLNQAPPRVDVRSVPSRVHPLVPAAQLQVA